MAWLAVDEDGCEYVYELEPYRENNYWSNSISASVGIPKGTIEKIIGRELTWEDEAVELKQKRIEMDTKEFRITIPDGYEIDKENSTFECVKFKRKELTYEDVAKDIFKDKSCYYIKGSTGCIEHTWERSVFNSNNPNNATSEKQLKKLFAINKLMNVAKYLNGDWKPNFKKDEGWYHYMGYDNKIYTYHKDINELSVYFKSRELAEQAISILGEDTICLALSTDW